MGRHGGTSGRVVAVSRWVDWLRRAPSGGAIPAAPPGGDLVPAYLEPGRHTHVRDGETPAQAMNRLTAGGGRDVLPGDADRWLLVGQLVEYAAKLDTLVREADQPIQLRWREVFSPELDLVRRARNSVVHGVDIGDDNLRDAVGLSRRLLDLSEL